MDLDLGDDFEEMEDISEVVQNEWIFNRILISDI